MTLGQLASIIRSKNAGPFQITIDIMFESKKDYDLAVNSVSLTPKTIAKRYNLKKEEVAFIPFPRVNAIKITLPRKLGSRGSGSIGDLDVYGAQQHGPLVDLQIT